MNSSLEANNNTTSGSPTENFPGAFDCYRTSWRQYKKYFLKLLLIVIVSWLIAIPAIGLHMHDLSRLFNLFFSTGPLFPEFEGFGFYVFFALLYIFLIGAPVDYGIAYAALRAARNDEVETKNLFAAFSNYKNAVLAYFLSALISVAGFIMLIIPGFIFVCRLIFIPFLITDKKLSAMESIKESWRLTKGHTVTIFLMFIIAFFLTVIGLLLAGIGLIFTVIWIELAFAHLYHTVSTAEQNGNIFNDED